MVWVWNVFHRPMSLTQSTASGTVCRDWRTFWRWELNRGKRWVVIVQLPPPALHIRPSLSTSCFMEMWANSHKLLKHHTFLFLEFPSLFNHLLCLFQYSQSSWMVHAYCNQRPCPPENCVEIAVEGIIFCWLLSLGSPLPCPLCQDRLCPLQCKLKQSLPSLPVILSQE